MQLHITAAVGSISLAALLLLNLVCIQPLLHAFHSHVTVFDVMGLIDKQNGCPTFELFCRLALSWAKRQCRLSKLCYKNLHIWFVHG